MQRFVRERLVPAENHLEEHDEVPSDLVEAMKEMGLFGLTVPEEFGGIGLSVSQEVQVNFELGRTAPAFRSVFGTNIGIGSQGILMDGTAEQKAEYLPRVASGELVMSFALTEPDAGSDAASFKTRAEPDGDHYVLNGTKRFITNAPRAGAFTLMARTGGPGAARGLGVHRAGRPAGHQARQDRQEDGPARHHDLRRDPRERSRAGREHHRRRARPGFQDRDEGARPRAAQHLGGGLRHGRNACSTSRLRYARERKQFGKAIGEFQLIQAMLADSQAELQAGWALVREVRPAFRPEAGARLDPDISMRVSCTKLFCTEMGRPSGRPRRPDPRRRRLHQRIPGRALLPRRAPAAPLRGHDADPANDRRPRAAGPRLETDRRHPMATSTRPSFHWDDPLLLDAATD